MIIRKILREGKDVLDDGLSTTVFPEDNAKNYAGHALQIKGLCAQAVSLYLASTGLYVAKPVFSNYYSAVSNVFIKVATYLFFLLAFMFTFFCLCTFKYFYYNDFKLFLLFFKSEPLRHPVAAVSGGDFFVSYSPVPSVVLLLVLVCFSPPAVPIVLRSSGASIRCTCSTNSCLEGMVTVSKNKKSSSTPMKTVELLWRMVNGFTRKPGFLWTAVLMMNKIFFF
ncbi:hypothetical protein BD770DRAFT_412645 [Pilaira anomala]|nr:hypothetical protein BD770DRAFT_412645 [Pilaira anomala]